MRHLFLAFLIALLPLRGWVSDAMATSMLGSQTESALKVATKIIADHAHELGAKDHIDLETKAPITIQAAVDCTEHIAAVNIHEADLHCDSCSACQACHAIALCPTAADVAAVFSLSTLPRAAAAQFASASAALGVKPPIF